MTIVCKGADKAALFLLRTFAKATTIKTQHTTSTTAAATEDPTTIWKSADVEVEPKFWLSGEIAPSIFACSF